MADWKNFKLIGLASGSILSIVWITTLLAQDPPPTRAPGPQVASLLASQALELPEGGEQLRRLLARRYNVALEELKHSYMAYETGEVPGQAVVDAGARLMEAELALAEDTTDRVAVLQKTLEVVNEFESAFQALVDIGEQSPIELQRLRFERLSVEINLLKAKQQEDGE